MFRQASRLLGRPTCPSRIRALCTEVPAANPNADSAFIESWKKVIPIMDPPKTPSTYTEPRPPTPSSLPSKLTVNFVLPYSSELSGKEVCAYALLAFSFFLFLFLGFVWIRLLICFPLVFQIFNT